MLKGKKGETRVLLESQKRSQRTKFENSWQARGDLWGIDSSGPADMLNAVGHPFYPNNFEDMVQVDADKDCEQVFIVT